MDKTPNCERCGKSGHRPFRVKSDLMSLRVCRSCAAYAQVLEQEFPNGLGALTVDFIKPMPYV